MRQMILDTEAVRIMLIMRRQILNEFGAWISLDDENAHTAIRDYGLKSKDQSLRKLAKQLGPLIGESTNDEAEHEKPKAKTEQPEAVPATNPNKTAKKRIYRGQVIKS